MKVCKQYTPAITKTYPKNLTTPHFQTLNPQKLFRKFPKPPKPTKIPLKLPCVKMVRASRDEHPAPCLPATWGCLLSHTPPARHTHPSPLPTDARPSLALRDVPAPLPASRSATPHTDAAPSCHQPATPHLRHHLLLPRAYACPHPHPIISPPARTHIPPHALELFAPPHTRASRTHPR